MKKIVLNVVFLLIINSLSVSCQTLEKTKIQEDTFIPYLLPDETESFIYKKIKTLLPESNLLGLTFEFIPEGAINIYINIFKNGYSRNHNLTNRKVFINDTFYPLVFEMDNTFYTITKESFPIWKVSRADPNNKRNDIITEEKIPSLEERKKLRAIYQRSNIIKHRTPILKINLKGEIIE